MPLLLGEGPPQRDQAALQGVLDNQEEGGGADQEPAEAEGVGREGEGAGVQFNKLSGFREGFGDKIKEQLECN